MTINTERLILYPASDEKIKDLIENEESTELRAAYSEMLEGCIENPDLRIYYAPWFMELKEKPNTVVGNFCFKGVNDGVVEIGYGLYDGFCGKGYMTEAVTEITKWVLSQEGIVKVEAEAEASNLASQKVLARAGFIANGETGEEGPRFVYVGEK